jgi:PAS domain S-box-containing protein
MSFLNWFLPNTLQKKITFITIGVISFFGFTSLVFIYFQTADNLIKAEKAHLINSTKYQTINISNILSTSFDIAHNLASFPQVASYLLSKDPSLEKSLLNLFNNYNIGNHYSSIYLLDLQGNALVSTDPSFVGKNYAFRDYFIQSIAGHDHLQPAVGVTSKELGYYFSTPVKNGAKIVGILVLKMSPDNPDQVFFSADISSSDNMMIVDRYGVVIHSLKPSQLYKSLGVLSDQTIDEIRRKQLYPDTIAPLSYQALQDSLESTDDYQVFDVYDKLDSAREILYLGKTPGYPLFLVSEFNYSTIADKANTTALILGIFVLLAAIVSGLLLLIMVGKFVSPINRLSTSAKLISEGGLNKNIIVKTGDEIESLSISLNQMVTNLVEAKSNVESQVASRTAELEKLNQDMSLKSTEVDRSRLAIINVLEDVEAEKAQTSALLAGIGEGVLAVDQNYKIIYVNSVAETLLGRKSADLIGKIYHKYLKSSDSKGNHIKASDRAFKISMSTGKSLSTSVTDPFYYYRQDGSKFPVAITVSPILLNGRVIGGIDVFRDITHEIEVDKMKTEFISLASHQLRTPLSAMKWFADMLLKGDAGKLKKDQQEFVQNIYDSNERMIELVNSLLNISRIESGRLMINPVLTHLPELIDDVVKDIKTKLDFKKQNLVVSIHPSLPEINLDKSLTRQVYLNLLTNAIKYTPEGGDISVMVSKDHNDIVTQISDSGYGIPAKDHHKVFQKFFRSENIVKHETDGSGLGLYLIKAVIESSGGKIWFKSDEGKGTSFWFTLPIKGVAPKQGEVTLDS